MNSANETVIDYITGEKKPNQGAEANRQKVERRLVEEKGYAISEIDVDAGICLKIGTENYRSKVDLVVSVSARPFLAIKCAAGSLDSREREILSAARLLADYQLPLAAASDGEDIIIWDTVSGKRIGQGFDQLPNRHKAEKILAQQAAVPLAPKDRERQQLIFRSYDSMNVNR